MGTCDLNSFWPVICQLVQVGHIVAALLFLLVATVGVMLGFVCDLCTWFSLKIFEFYLPLFMRAVEFLSLALSYNC